MRPQEEPSPTQTTSCAIFINRRKWTPPVLNASARNAVTTTLACRQPNLPPPNALCGDGYLVPRLRIPPARAPYPQYDGWLTILDPPAGYGYDLWRARRGANGAATMSYLYALASQAFAAQLGGSAPQTYLTGPTLDPTYYGDSGQAFYEAYEVRFGGPPDSSAIYGYEAMSAVLHAIDVAPTKRRSEVVNGFFNINGRSSPLGTYSIDATGDTTLKRYGGYRVRGGGLQFDRALSTTGGAT